MFVRVGEGGSAHSQSPQISSFRRNSQPLSEFVLLPAFDSVGILLRLFVARFQPQRLAELPQGVVELPLLGQNDSQIQMGERGAWLQPDEFLVFASGLRLSVVGGQFIPERKPRFPVIRPELHRRAVIFDRLGPAAQFRQRLRFLAAKRRVARPQPPGTVVIRHCQIKSSFGGVEVSQLEPAFG